jgi:transposase
MMDDFVLIKKLDFDTFNACIGQLREVLQKPKERVMSIEDVAEMLDIELQTAKKFIKKYKVPAVVLSEKTIRYKESEIWEKVINANILKTR